MGAIANLHASLTWDIDDFQRGTAQIENAFKGIINLAGNVADAVVRAGQRMTLGLTLPIGGLALLTTKMASDAAELQSAFDYTFGAMSRSMNRWAEETGNAMGRSTQEMQQGALAFGQLFKAAAPTEEAAARMSQRFTELAQDAASFYNTDFDTALEKIRSGLTGEAEPLRDFGVFLSEAAVQAKAVEMGLIDAGQELNEYGKIMARSALIAEGLSDAQDDVLRTSGSLANQVRRIRAGLQELGTEIGQYLAPYARALAGAIEGVVNWFRELPEWAKKAAVGFGVFLAASGPLLIALTTAAAVVLPLLILKFGLIFAAVSLIINPIGSLIVLVSKFAGESGALGAALGRVLPILLRLAGPLGIVIGLLTVFGDDIAAGLRRYFEAVTEALGPKVQELFARLVQLGQELSAMWSRLTDSPVGKWLQKAWELIGPIMESWGQLLGFMHGQLLGGIIDALSAIVEAISGAVETVNDLISGDWSGAWDAAVQTVGRAALRMADWLGFLWPWASGILRMLGEITGAELTVPATLGGSQAPAATMPLGRLSRGGEAANGADRDYSVPGSGPSGRSSRSGPTARELADRREEIRLEQQLAVAREAGDLEAIRALERQRDLRERIARYERAGLDLADARIAAERDMAEMDAARALARDKYLRDMRIDTERQVAELNNDYEHLRHLDEEEERERLIQQLRQEGYDLTVAEEIVAARLAAIEEARTGTIARRLREQQEAHAIELARLRGDDTSGMEEDARIRARAEVLQQDFGRSASDALDIALRESADRAQAGLQGTFRDAFRNGLQAAMNGDLKGFFEGWMRDRTFNALSRVLDRLADQLANLVSGQGGGGGLLGALGSVLGVVSGTAKSTGFAGGDKAWAMASKPPGFNTGGSFRVMGHPGIDQNLLSLNGNPIARVSSGEIMDIRRGDPPGSAGPLAVTITMDPSTGALGAFVRDAAGRVVAEATPGIAQSGAALAMQQSAMMRDRSFGG